VAGNLLTESDPLGHATTYGYDHLYRRTSTTDADSGVTNFIFDAAGNLLSLTDPVIRLAASKVYA
jgi:YD repeat-containing protein